jgi:transcription antitermination factor NusG
MNLEEDEEPMWYLLNCIATQELDLLRQCRARCQQFLESGEVVKFVVPIERSIRSHGANRMVTDTKVAYPGYVFAKLKLCEPVYEAIQELDLCRSWMGTVHRKGTRKLPPIPLALNEMEIEKFGLENLDQNIDFDQDEPAVDEMWKSGVGIILDSEENDRQDNERAKVPKLDPEQLKVYRDIRVDDMIQVIGENKFKGEDGIVKRLKDGKLMIRFFTYGSRYDEWLDPVDVRKLTHDEVLRGLSGPSSPITQLDLENRSSTFPSRGKNDRTNPQDRNSLRGALMSNLNSRGPRNTRFETTARGERYKRDIFGRSEEERKRDERSWSSQRSQKQQGVQTNQQSKSQNNNPLSDSESQWGRFPERNTPRYSISEMETRKRRENGQGIERNKGADKYGTKRSPEVQKYQSAIDGEDWSAFVSPSPSLGSKNEIDDDNFFNSLMSELNENDKSTSSPLPSTSISQYDDDFFSSLMSDLNSGDNFNSYQSDKSQKDPLSSRDDGDFFAALQAELNESTASNKAKTNDVKRESLPQRGSKQSSFRDVTENAIVQDDFFTRLEQELSEKSFHRSENNDFFAQLEAELSSMDSLTSDEIQKETPSSQPNLKSKSSNAFSEKSQEPSNGDDDDFFARLEAELSPSKEISSKGQKKERVLEEKSQMANSRVSSPSKEFPNVEDGSEFFSKLQQELSQSPKENDSKSMWQGDNFFSQLEADIGFSGGKSNDAISGSDDLLLSLGKELNVSPLVEDNFSASGTGVSSDVQKIKVQTTDSKSRNSNIRPDENRRGDSNNDSLTKKTVVDLRDMLRERGLKVSGNKAELIQRLLEK